MDEGPTFQVLLFDLGGVLVDFAGFEELSRLVPEPMDPGAIRSRWIASPAVARFERGAGTGRQFADGVIEEFGLELTTEEFISAFMSWARGPYPGTCELLRPLRDSHRLACLSNSNSLHTPIHRRGLEPLFEHCYFSDELGLVKPQLEIYEHVLRDLEVPPSQIAFFDDTRVNVQVARRCGVAAWQVQGLSGLEVRLRALGLA
jgi:putative hydrolase of the HAD superfamily